MKKPIIAITADSMVEPSAVTNLNFADFAPHDLKDGIIAAGGIPVILPFPTDSTQADELAEAHVRLFDGLIIPGGPDVDPTLYGEEPIRELGRTAYQRDSYEIALIRAAIEAQKPIFGICRGLQVIDVALGGTLYQDLITQDLHSTLKHSQATPGGFPTHHVSIEAKSRLSKLLGDSCYVNSRHHQAVKEVAGTLHVTATAQDGVIEALEGEQVLAVQWHPENMWREHPEQMKLFIDLVDRSNRRAALKG